MRGMSIVALAMVLFCFAASDAWPEGVASNGRVQNLEFAGAGDIESSNFYGITTLNLLAGGIAITFSGWFLSKRKTS